MGKLWTYLALTFILAGCSQQQQEEVKNQVNNTVSQVGNEAEHVGKQVETQTQPLVAKASNAATDSGITLRVKTAMGVSKALDSASIDVSTKNKVLYLQGTVKNSAQKTLALSIAKNTVGPDIKISDQLKVNNPPVGKS